jgi:hypothetical protein
LNAPTPQPQLAPRPHTHSQPQLDNQKEETETSRGKIPSLDRPVIDSTLAATLPAAHLRTLPSIHPSIQQTNVVGHTQNPQVQVNDRSRTLMKYENLSFSILEMSLITKISPFTLHRINISEIFFAQSREGLPLRPVKSIKFFQAKRARVDIIGKEIRKLDMT